MTGASHPAADRLGILHQPNLHIERTANPWTTLDVVSGSTSVLPADRPFVRAYNAAIAGETASEHARIPTHGYQQLVRNRGSDAVMPPVCLLLLNTGMWTPT